MAQRCCPLFCYFRFPIEINGKIFKVPRVCGFVLEPTKEDAGESILGHG